MISNLAKGPESSVSCSMNVVTSKRIPHPGFGAGDHETGSGQVVVAVSPASEECEADEEHEGLDELDMGLRLHRGIPSLHARTNLHDPLVVMHGRPERAYRAAPDFPLPFEPHLTSRMLRRSGLRVIARQSACLATPNAPVP